MTRFSDFEDTEKVALYDAIIYSKKEMFWSVEEAQAIRDLKKELEEELDK